MITIKETTRHGKSSTEVLHEIDSITSVEQFMESAAQRSPYYAKLDYDKAAMILDDLFCTGVSDYGWARYTKV